MCNRWLHKTIIGIKGVIKLAYCEELSAFTRAIVSFVIVLYCRKILCKNILYKKTEEFRL